MAATCQLRSMGMPTASTSRPTGWLPPVCSRRADDCRRRTVVAHIYKSDTHYDVLGVSFAATPDQVKAAYRKLSKQLHPDVSNGRPASEFTQLQEAYATLSDASKRTAYDRRYMGFSCFSTHYVEPPQPSMVHGRRAEGRAANLPKYMDGLTAIRNGQLYVDGMYMGEM